MNLPLALDTVPMEAATASEIPSGEDWQYEPKWDGFRCLAFRDGAEVVMMSKSGQRLDRYFPEIVRALTALSAKKFVLDGELILVDGKHTDFDALLQRIHPAESRIARLAEETPATFVIFDLLVDAAGKDLTSHPLERRRKALEQFAGKTLNGKTIRLSPVTSRFESARKWFQEMAGELDGIIAKRTDLAYHQDARDAMVKIKNLRTADCVVGGFRYASKGKVVGSLLLGLYDDAGLLNHVGFTSGIKTAEKPALTRKLSALIQPPGFTGTAPGGPSRWSTRRSEEWKPLKPELVVEVQYDHFSGHRFRHGTRLLRWRPDKKPSSCSIEQVARASRSPIDLLR
jgi:ATP-dependent DNA ligase